MGLSDWFRGRATMVQRKTKGGKSMASAKETKEVEELLGSIGIPDNRHSLRIYKMGPVMWQGRKCAGIGAGAAIKNYDGDALPDWEEMLDEISSEFGGGKYMLRAVDPKGKFLKDGARRFSVSTDEYPPKLLDEPPPGDYELTPPYMRRGSQRENNSEDIRREMQELKQQLMGGSSDKGIEAMIAAMQTASAQNIEALKMMTAAAVEDKKDRREEQSQQTRLLMESMAKSFDAAVESQKSIATIMQSSKEENAKLMQAMIADSKENSTAMLGLFMQALMQGVELGSAKGDQEPKSDLAEVVGSFTDAFKSVVESGTAQRLTSADQSQTAIRETVRKTLKGELRKRKSQQDGQPATQPTAQPVAQPATQPATRPQEQNEATEEVTDEEIDMHIADNALGILVGAIKERPENPSLLATIAPTLSPELVRECVSAGDTAPVFRWIEEHGSQELVDELKTLLADEDNHKWLMDAFKTEEAALKNGE